MRHSNSQADTGLDEGLLQRKFEMTTRDEDAADSGKNTRFKKDLNESSALDVSSRLLNEILISNMGELTPEAQAQIDLRSDEGRGIIIEQLVRELAPREVSPSMWREWLQGGESPFRSRGLKKPVRLPHGLGKELARGPKSLKQHRERVERARAELAYAEHTLAYHEALDKSLIEVTIYDHLINLLAPMFAMGPAWTVMRALSAHASDKLVDDMTSMFDGKAKDAMIKQFHEERAEETAKILDSLDYYSGIEEFEESLREAVKAVVEEFHDSEITVVKDGRRRRSKDRMMTSPHPEARDGHEEVLGGFE